MVEPMVVMAGCGEAGDELVTKRSERWRSTPVEVNGDGGRRAGEGLVRCGILRGPWGAFIWAGVEGSGQGMQTNGWRGCDVPVLKKDG
jgi:hypothetical protein